MRWWDVRKGSVGVTVTYGYGDSGLLIEKFAVRPGDSFDVRFDMGKNLRTRNKQENSYIDAQDLANNMDSVTSIEISDDTIVKGVSKHLQRLKKSSGLPKGVRVCIVLNGEHWYNARLSIPDEYTLMLDGLKPTDE